MKVKKLCLLILCAISCFSGSAQVTFSSLQEVFDYANKHEVSIQMSIMNEQISAVKVKQAKSQLYPQISGSAGYNDNISLSPTLVPSNLLNSSAPPGEYKKYKFGKKYMSDATVDVQWNLLDFQKRLLVKAALSEMEASKLSTASNKWNTYMNLASVYYSILITSKSFEFYNENVKTANLLLTSATDKYKNGMISEDVLDRGKIQQINAEKDLHATESSLKKLLCQLQSYLGTDDLIVVNDRADKYIGTDADLYFSTLHPDVKYKESLLDYDKLQLKQSKASNYPSLSLSYQYQYHWTSDKFMNYGGAISYNSQLLGVKLSIPIFTGFYNKNKIKEAEWNVKQAQFQLNATRTAKKKEDEMLKIDYLQSKHDFEDASTILTLRQDADSKISYKYQKGIISLDERLDKYQNLLNEQSNYIKNMGNYLIALYQVYIRHINF
jgi:outer membrane protein